MKIFYSLHDIIQLLLTLKGIEQLCLSVFPFNGARLHAHAEEITNKRRIHRNKYSLVPLWKKASHMTWQDYYRQSLPILHTKPCKTTADRSFRSLRKHQILQDSYRPKLPIFITRPGKNLGPGLLLHLTRDCMHKHDSH